MQLEEERAEGRRQRAESDEFSVCRNCARRLVRGHHSSFIVLFAPYSLLQVQHPEDATLHNKWFANDQL
jgi:hypothetical protein